MTQPNLTARQQKWMASVRESLERDTGRSLAEWVAIARTCPESAHRARLKWFKETHGLMQNRASQVLGEAFEPHMTWSDPDALIAALWTDPARRTIFEAVDGVAGIQTDVIRTARKGYTAWSRRVQFAAVRPAKGGGAMLGLAVPAGLDRRLSEPRSEPWSERLTARLPLASPADVDECVRALIKQAWDGA